MTGSHTKEKPIHYIATLPGGGVTVLQTLAKILLLEKLTGIDFLKLYSGGVIADSGSLYSLALLECMDAQKALETFIELAPDAFPKTSFFAHQTIRTRSRFTPTILHDRLDELLGDRTLESLQHGFSAGVINIEKDRSSRIAERIMVVPNLETGEKHYPEGSSGNIRLKDVIKAGSSVPNVNPPVTIEGKKGKHLDPTIDQNPALYGIELQRENPLAALGMVSFGSYTPSSEKFSDLFNELSARNFLDWIRGMIRQTYKKAEEHELIEKLLGVKVLDLCTEISKDNKDHPRFNPIDSTSKQLSRLCNSALNDIENRREEYLAHANALLKSYRIRHNLPEQEELSNADFNAALSKSREICEKAISSEKERTAEHQAQIDAHASEIQASPKKTLANSFFAAAGRLASVGGAAIVQAAFTVVALKATPAFSAAKKAEEMPPPPILKTQHIGNREVA